MVRSALFTVIAIIVLGVSSPAGADNLSVSFTTTPVGGSFAPRNIVAVWIENAGGTFVKTVGRWANVRRAHLVAWTAQAGAQDADAVSGATRLDHTGTLTVTWDLRDRAGALVPDGTYTIRMELCDSNASTPAENHQGTFTFVKNGQSSSTTNGSNGGFEAVAIAYVAANPAACGNGVVDPGETCDGNCPTTCAPSTDACAPTALVGAAAACTAACTTTTISACTDGDGCCPAGCDSTMDMDCVAAGPGSGSGSGSASGGPAGATGPIVGGCAAGGDGAGVLAAGALLGLTLFGRRRRR